MMKKIMMLLLLVSTFLGAASLQLETGYTTALAKAQKENKPVMLVLSSHQCRYCDLFDSETLSDSMVIEALNRDFVSAIVYAAQGEYAPEILITGATPTIWFLQPNGDPMFQPIMGAVGKEDFVKALAIVHEEYLKGQ
jgi:thioredoxin-related protein